MNARLSCFLFGLSAKKALYGGKSPLGHRNIAFGMKCRCFFTFYKKKLTQTSDLKRFGL